MVALAPHGRAVVPGVFDAGAARLKGHAADAAHFLVDVPLPHSHAVPLFHLHLHRCFVTVELFSYLSVQYGIPSKESKESALDAPFIIGLIRELSRTVHSYDLLKCQLTQ